MYFDLDQVDDSGLRLLFLTLNLGGTMDFLSSQERQTLSEHTAFVQKIYESKSLHPSEEDLLNGLYELRYEGLALLIHRYWNEADAILGRQIRERFKQDFLEVSCIEALENILPPISN